MTFQIRDISVVEYHVAVNELVRKGLQDILVCNKKQNSFYTIPPFVSKGVK